jgi:Tfp pilus assembly ATPase PilU
MGFIDILSDIKPSAKSCLKIESSSEFSGVEVSTLKQYSSSSFLRKKKCSISVSLLEKKSFRLNAFIKDLPVSEVDIPMDDQI